MRRNGSPEQERRAAEWADALSWMDELTPRQRRIHQIKTIVYQIIAGGFAAAVAYLLSYWWLPKLVSRLACGVIIAC